MKKIDQHEFDEIFRAGLKAPGLSEVDEDWTLMIAIAIRSGTSFDAAVLGFLDQRSIDGSTQ